MALCELGKGWQVVDGGGFAPAVAGVGLDTARLLAQLEPLIDGATADPECLVRPHLAHSGVNSS